MKGAVAALALAGALLLTVAQKEEMNPNTRVIIRLEESPSELVSKSGIFERRLQGPTTWVCAHLNYDAPWIASNALYGYMNKGNSAKKDYTKMHLYPVVRIFNNAHPKLCMYLPREDHCYPPSANLKNVHFWKQFQSVPYVAIRFWGVATKNRIDYYTQQLDKLSRSNKANFDDGFGYLSEFPNNIIEVRYNLLAGDAKPKQSSIRKKLINPSKKTVTKTRVNPAAKNKNNRPGRKI